MKYDLGFIVTVIAFFGFYLYIALLRGRKKRLQREEILAVKKQGKKAKAPDFTKKPIYEVRSWILVALAVILMLGGLMARYSPIFPTSFQSYWWIAVSLGVVVLGLSIK